MMFKKTGAIKKNILVIFTSELVPVTMMNQNRTISMIKRLAVDHEVFLLAADINDTEKLQLELPEVKGIYYYRHHSNFNILRKFLFYIKGCFLVCFLLFPENYHTIINCSLRNELKNRLKNHEFDVLLLHYWYLQKVLPPTIAKIKIIIDTHGLIFKKVQLEANQKKCFFSKILETRYASNYQKKEINALNHSDLVVFNSTLDQLEYTDVLKGTSKSVTISNGQDLAYFQPNNDTKASNTILFYGSLGGFQNQEAFRTFWNDIYPLIVKINKSVRLIVLGNKPPRWISDLKSDRVIVTGFVNDIRPYVSQSNVCILPLSLGAGFRGRVIELMAMGVPVVGTHNALDNLNMIHGTHGYITDDHVEMANYALEILSNQQLNQKLSDNCIRFVNNNFNIDATYGKLSGLISTI